jgi:hypothetical protein
MNIRNRLKSSARSVLRPFWLVVWRRIEARISTMQRHDAAWRQHIEARLEQTDAAWQQHLPAFLNAVSSVGAFGHELLRYRKEGLAGLAALDGQIAEVRSQVLAAKESLAGLATLDDQITEIRAQLLAALDSQVAMRESLDALAPLRDQANALAARVEFVRREILFEMKYGGSVKIERPSAPPASLQPHVVSTDKLAAFRQSGLRLNLGCGHIPLDGYVNVDMRAVPGVDIVAEAGNIPVEPGTVQEVHSAHMLEHFPQEELRRRLLPYWFSLLVPGGIFKAIVPDGEAMLAHFSTGDYPFEEFREVLFGAQDYHGDFHFNMFLPRTLQSLLEEAGFVDIRVPVQGRRNGLCYEFEINAQRP